MAKGRISRLRATLCLGAFALCALLVLGGCTDAFGAARQGLDADGEVSVADMDFVCSADGTAKLVSAEKASGEVAVPESVECQQEEYRVTSINFNAFGGNTAVTSVKLPPSIERIDNKAFYHATALQEVAFSEGLELIGVSSFDGCGALKSVELPRSLNSIGTWAFANTGLTSLEIPAGIGYVPEGICVGCPELQEVRLSEATTSIGATAFNSCPSLKAINLPEGLEQLKSGTLTNCPSLERVFIPATVDHIGYNSIDKDTTLVVVDGSYAEAYAQEQGFDCIVL